MLHRRELPVILQLCRWSAPAKPSTLVSARSRRIRDVAAGGNLAGYFFVLQRRPHVCRGRSAAGPGSRRALARRIESCTLRCGRNFRGRGFDLRALRLYRYAKPCACTSAALGRFEYYYPIYQRPHRAANQQFAWTNWSTPVAGRIVRSLDSASGSVRESTALYRAKSCEGRAGSNSRRVALFQRQYSNYQEDHRLKPVLHEDHRLKPVLHEDHRLKPVLREWLVAQASACDRLQP